MTVKVAINGYGTIGKRVADAVYLQKDMTLTGVAKTRPSWEARLAVDKNYPLYCPTDKKADFDEAGVAVQGSIEDMVAAADVVVDCTPNKIGAENKKTLYEPTKTKAIFQGGEKATVADTSFVAQCNYAESLGKDYVRVVSCNTTGLSRSLGALHAEGLIKKARVVLVRRSADPRDVNKGPINALVPSVGVPSHHGPDVNTVISDLPIVTSAVKASTTLMHLHALMVELAKDTTPEAVTKIFENTERIKLIEASHGLSSTAEIIEHARDLGRLRNDLYENALWQDSIHVADNELYFFQAIGQEAIVVPENIDAIRAMFELEKDAMKSIAVTNKSLGI